MNRNSPSPSRSPSRPCPFRTPRFAGGPRFLDPGWPLTRVAYQAEFAQAADGTIWFAEMARSVHTLRQVSETTPVSEVKVGAYSVIIDRKGSLWIGTRGDGLRRVPDPEGAERSFG